MRQVIRWGIRHGLMSRATARGARAGDISAALMIYPAFVDNPFPHYETIRAKGRLYDNGFVLNTASHAVATAVLRSPDFGVVGRHDGDVPRILRLAQTAGGRGPLGPALPPSMLAADPPDHTRYRKLVSRAFTVKAVAGLRSRTEEIAAGLLDGLASRGGGGDSSVDPRIDLIADYASLLPATVIADMLGAPVEMSRQFLAWGAEAGKSLDAGLTLREFRRSERGLRALQTWMEGHFAYLRAHPGDNILSTLVHAHAAEGKLTQDELSATAMLLLAAGFETTVNLIGNGTALLVNHPEQRERLRVEPSLWPNAVDEILRFDSPVQRTGRVSHRDTVVAGERVGAGRMVMTLLGGANRDPEVFDEPQRFDVGRANAGEHVAFSSGIHYCLGAGLARMEGEVGLRALFDRFPDLALAGSPHRRPTRVLRGYDAMPVRLTATVDA
jgi:cytochrome P450